MIKVQENIPLKDLTTFQIGGQAKCFTVVKNLIGLKGAVKFSKENKIPFFIIGGGSNILAADAGFPGLVIKNEILGRKIEGDRLIVGSGEKLDDIIQFTVKKNLFGLENLSGIPGTVGGAVAQNAGAYGIEIKDWLYSAKGINTSSGRSFLYKNRDCQFGYRGSILKKNKNLVITEVQFKLNKKFVPQSKYAGLRDFLTKNKKVNAQEIRKMILKIREEKLPDWRKTGTAGSFFKNPIITKNKFDKLKAKFPGLPGFPESNKKIKISLAWILDKVCGLKGYKMDKVGLYEKQPLVMVNLGGATTKDVFNLSEYVKKLVNEKMGIEVEEEVEKM